MKFEEIERLVRLIAETDVDEVEVSEDGATVRITRRQTGAVANAGGTSVQVLPVAVAGQPGWSAGPPPPPLAAEPAPAAAAAEAAADPEDDEEGLHVITAQTIGTFYRRPSPETEPFVKEGDVIKKGQVICILEAMKTMNEIESDAAGTVVKVFAEDGQPVEYGEKLFALRPL